MTPAVTNTHNDAYGAIIKNRISPVILEDSEFTGILNALEIEIFTP